VGVIIAIFQAVTQIHEQTLGFILKLVVLVLVLVIAGGWMFQLLQEFTLQLFGIIAA
jgi:flagellar biosynthesis protein FliQ